MDVYPTRRSCGYEDWIYAATRKNAVTAELDEDDVHLEEGWHPFLFPIHGTGPRRSGTISTNPAARAPSRTLRA